LRKDTDFIGMENDFGKCFYKFLKSFLERVFEETKNRDILMDDKKMI